MSYPALIFGRHANSVKFCRGQLPEWKVVWFMSRTHAILGYSIRHPPSQLNAPIESPQPLTRN
jgi:hypothetical protein